MVAAAKLAAYCCPAGVCTDLGPHPTPTPALAYPVPVELRRGLGKGESTQREAVGLRIGEASASAGACTWRGGEGRLCCRRGNAAPNRPGQERESYGGPATPARDTSGWAELPAKSPASGEQGGKAQDPSAGARPPLLALALEPVLSTAGLADGLAAGLAAAAAPAARAREQPRQRVVTARAGLGLAGPRAKGPKGVAGPCGRGRGRALGKGCKGVAAATAAGREAAAAIASREAADWAAQRDREPAAATAVTAAAKAEFVGQPRVEGDPCLGGRGLGPVLPVQAVGGFLDGGPEIERRAPRVKPDPEPLAGPQPWAAWGLTTRITKYRDESTTFSKDLEMSSMSMGASANRSPVARSTKCTMTCLLLDQTCAWPFQR